MYIWSRDCPLSSALAPMPTFTTHSPSLPPTSFIPPIHPSHPTPLAYPIPSSVSLSLTVHRLIYTMSRCSRRPTKRHGGVYGREIRQRALLAAWLLTERTWSKGAAHAPAIPAYLPDTPSIRGSISTTHCSDKMLKGDTQRLASFLTVWDRYWYNISPL